MNNRFFRTFAFGTRLQFLVKTICTNDSVCSIQNIIADMVKLDGIIFDRFYYEQDNIGEILETEKYVFVINSWKEKNIILLDIYCDGNITKHFIYDLENKLKSVFKDDNILRYTTKQFLNNWGNYDWKRN